MSLVDREEEIPQSEASLRENVMAFSACVLLSERMSEGSENINVFLGSVMSVVCFDGECFTSFWFCVFVCTLVLLK